MSSASLIVTGRHFASAGGRSFEPVLEELITGADSEIHMLAYVIAPSAVPLLRLLEQALGRGVAIKMIVNALPDHPPMIVAGLERLATEFAHFQLIDFNDGVLHAKIIVSDRRRALVGSANFTWGGLVGNHEIGVIVEADAAWELAKLVDAVAHRLTRGG